MTSLCHRGLLAALFAFLVTACSVTPTTKDPAALGRLYSATSPGTWTGTVRSGGLSIQMVKTYLPDGKAYGVLLAKETRGGVSIVLPEVRFRSRWRVSGDIVETYDIEASATGLFKKGEVIRDHILSVRNDRIVARAEKDGLIQVLERLKSNR